MFPECPQRQSLCPTPRNFQMQIRVGAGGQGKSSGWRGGRRISKLIPHPPTHADEGTRNRHPSTAGPGLLEASSLCKPPCFRRCHQPQDAKPCLRNAKDTRKSPHFSNQGRGPFRVTRQGRFHPWLCVSHEHFVVCRGHLVLSRVHGTERWGLGLFCPLSVRWVP